MGAPRGCHRGLAAAAHYLAADRRRRRCRRLPFAANHPFAGKRGTAPEPARHSQSPAAPAASRAGEQAAARLARHACAPAGRGAHRGDPLCGARSFFAAGDHRQGHPAWHCRRPGGGRRHRHHRAGGAGVPAHRGSAAAYRQGSGDPGGGAAQRLARRTGRCRRGHDGIAFPRRECRDTGRRRAGDVRPRRRISAGPAGGQGGQGRSRQLLLVCPHYLCAAGRR